MVLTRATNQPGADGILGTADDIHEHTNTTSPFVDQNQTYTSHPSHQVFLREYELDADGKPVATGKLIANRDLGADGQFGTADDVELGGMATWAVVKAQARDILGIDLTDADVGNVPLLATDAVRQVHPRPERLAAAGRRLGPDGLLGTADDVLVEGNPAAPISPPRCALRTGHAFLDDIAHCADPRNSQTGALLTAGRRRRRSATTTQRRHLRQRAARRALHRRRRPRQREHRPDRRPPRLPLRAQPPGRAHQGGRSLEHAATSRS